MSKPIHILSLGAGVQSTTMALMAACGELTPMPDAAIFADTGDEPQVVYDHLAWLEKQLPFPIHKVTAGDLMEDSLRIVRSKKSGLLYMKGIIPAFVLKPDGGRGLLGRKCTADYKIRPIHQRTRIIVGKPSMNAWRKKFRFHLSNLAQTKVLKTVRNCDEWDEMQENALVEMWIGISSDEWIRAKPSREPWLRNTWPLLSAKISRNQCADWLMFHDFPTVPRSACKKCPFHSDEEWALQSPEDFAESVRYEKEIQMTASLQEALIGVPFLHETCVPLDKVDFKKRLKGKAQVSQFGNECEGLCGV